MSLRYLFCLRGKRLLNVRWFLLSLGLILITGFVVWQVTAAAALTVPPPAVAAPPTALSAPADAETAVSPSSPALQTDTAANRLYLPMVVNPSQCSLNAKETAVANLAMSDPGQGRSTMVCDPILSQVARQRAIDMATRNYFSHVDPDGYGPNYHVTQAGYVLPSWYGSAVDANNIESIAAGYSSADTVWAAWLGSGGHRAHVLAESSFWSDQTSYGIGYYYDAGSTYRHYWVFITAPPE